MLTELSTHVRDLFARHGLRCTRQREQIYSALAASNLHPTAEELLHTVRAFDPGLSLATVYNTLEVFTRVGLCRKLSTSCGSIASRFDACVGDHVHLATGDGRILDIPEDLSSKILGRLSGDLLAELEWRLGVRIAGLSIQVMAGPAPCLPSSVDRPA